MAAKKKAAAKAPKKINKKKSAAEAKPGKKSVKRAAAAPKVEAAPKTYDRPARLTEEAEAFVKNYAAEHELTGNEALDRLIGTARSRLTALEKYRVRQPGAAKKPRARKASQPPPAEPAT